jgi:YHS domain-containing protein
MSDINVLVNRIEGAFTAVKEKAREQQQGLLQEHLQRRERLKEYEKAREQIVAIAKPRLEALAKRAGERVSITPYVSETCRSAIFDFRTKRAHITLTVGVAPDQLVQNAIVEFDLRIVPVLWDFNRHEEFRTPISAVDGDGLARWLDDRIVGFVELFIQIHRDELYEKAEYVEDPVAKVKFPRFAAGETLEQDGQTYFFIDGTTKAEFIESKNPAAKSSA